jgi:hypothetical protein
MRRVVRAAATALVGGVLVAGLAACGDDDDDAATDPSDEGTTSTAEGTSDTSGDGGEGAEEATASPEFCEGFHGLDVAFAGAPEDPAQVEAFVTEQVDPNVALIEASIPDEVGDSVEVMLAGVEQLKATGDMTAFQTPEFMAAQGEVYPWLAGGCGWQALDVVGVDFAFEGVPDELDAGMTVITLENATETTEMHEIALLKLADDADITLDELLALSQEEAQQYLDPEVPPVFAFAPPGETSGISADLVPGDYVYACFIPTGTTMEAEGQGAPHFVEGMAGELTVT